MEERPSKYIYIYIYSKNDRILKSGKSDYSVAKPIGTKMPNLTCFGAVLQS